MYINSAQTELVVMATQYMTKQERTGRAINMSRSSVTDPMTFVRHYDCQKKITSALERVTDSGRNQENGIRP